MTSSAPPAELPATTASSVSTAVPTASSAPSAPAAAPEPPASAAPLAVTLEHGAGSDKQGRNPNAELLLPDEVLLTGGSLAVVEVKSSSHESAGTKSERVRFEVAAIAAEEGDQQCPKLTAHDGSASLWRYGSNRTLANGRSYVVTFGLGGQLEAQRVVPREQAQDALLANLARRRALNPAWRCAPSP